MRRSGGRRCLESRLPASHTLTRVLAAAALTAAVLVVGVLALGSRGGSYTVHARFQNASQLVKGNLVQVAGVPVGKIQSIDLTPDGQADVRMKITDAGYRPLRRGTKAVIRQASLSGVANRYIDLQLPAADHQETIPAGGVIDQSDTTTAVDLDQLFNTFDPKTRKALSGLIRGSAASYAGKGEEANAGWAYLNPSLAASSRLFKALDADTPALKRFIGESSQLVGDLATRRADLAGLVDHLATTTGAIGRQKQALSTAHRRPAGLHAPRRHHLRQPARHARRPPAARRRVEARGQEAAALPGRAAPAGARRAPDAARPLRARALARRLQRPHRAARSPRCRCATPPWGRPSATARSATAPSRPRRRRSRRPTPELATARPYAPDLTGWFDDFSHSGLYDALGGASRAAPYVNLFAPVNGVLKPLLDPLAQSDAFKNATSLNQRWRCPGSVERGATWKPSADFPCDASEGAARTMKRVLLTLLVVAGLGVGWIVLTGAGENPDKGKYWVQFDNAFGLIQGGDLKVAGVRAGKITDIKLDKRTKHALIGFKIDKNGFGSLRSDTSCESRPQSLIGEYFVDCQPGTAKQELKPGAVIPVTRTASTVAPDLVNDILRRPYRERLSLIIGSLGAGVAGNAENLNAAIRRASPALRETDKVLATLGAQNRILADLTVNADKVVGDLAANRKDVGRFVTKAKDTAQASAERRGDIAAGLRELPGFLEQLQPTMKALGQVADDQGSALHNLDSSSKQLTTFFDQLGPFADASRPAFRSLGSASKSRRSRRQGGAAGDLPARRLRRRHAGARQEPLDRACSTSTTASTPSRRTRAAPAARATPASRRCCSTPTTRRPRRRSSTRTTTSSRSAPSSGRAPTTPARRRSRRTRTSSASAARASGRSSRA